MKRFSFVLVVCFGLILSHSPLSFSDFSEYLRKGHIGEVLAYDCSCYSPPLFGLAQGRDICESHGDDYIIETPWCLCFIFGINPCNAPTPEQIAALAALLEALVDAQNATNIAADDIATLNNLYDSIESIKATFFNAKENFNKSVKTIDNSLQLLERYIEDGQALDAEALGIVRQQIATALLNRGDSENTNRNGQGSKIGDPVILASGVEDYQRTDLSYKVVNSLIKIQRRYRSNRNEEVSSFGKGWFFNYDTKVIVGRKPLIKERKQQTKILSEEASQLAADAEEALNTIFTALENANYYADIASEKQNEIDALTNQINTLLNEINSQTSIAQSAAAEAYTQAAIADTPEAYADAESAQEAATQAATYAAVGEAKKNSAENIAADMTASLQSIENNRAQAGVNTELGQHKEAMVKEIEANLAAEAAEAAEEAAKEEELFPNNPYPSDPSVYFGAGFLKVIDDNGSPILYKQDEDGLFKPISDNGSYTGHIEQINSNYRFISKHGETREFRDTGSGIARLKRDIDLNGNRITYHYTNEKVSSIEDVFGRLTTLSYNNQGYIESVTDPQGYTYGYSYSDGKLAGYTDPAGNKWSYTYDESGNLSGRTNPLGNTYQYFYDNKGRVIEEVDEQGYSITYAYDPENKVTTMNDRRGKQTAYYYNDAHRLVRVVHPDNSEVQYGYDEHNNRNHIIDENGNETTFLYNQNNDVVRMTDALGNVTTITYDQIFNKVSSVTDPLGRTTRYFYDAHGNVSSIANADNSNKYFKYNQYGLRTGITDENGNTSLLSYDEYGHPAQVTHPDGTSRSFINDAVGRVTQITDENGAISTVEYNKLGKITRTIDPLGAENRIDYDSLQRRIKVTDAEGGTHVWAYSKRGDIIEEINPLGNITQYQYDAERNKIRTTYPNKTGVQFAYDSRNRLLEKLTFPGNRKTSFLYDDKGQLIYEWDAEGNATGTEYDELGRITAKVDAEGYATESSYDAVGNLILVTDANGNSQYYEYDAMDRRTRHADALGNSTTYKYSPTGKLVEKWQPNGTFIRYEYDTRDRLLKETGSDGTFKSFAYDDVGRKTLMASDDSSEERRQYDARGQLITVIDKYMGRIDYSYDLVGNRIQMIDPDNGVFSYSYDRANRLTTFTDPEGGKTRYEYDNMGRIVSMSYPNSTETVTTYNHDNRIKSIASYGHRGEVLSSFAYTYDAVGNKLSMKDENGDMTTYEYDKLYRLLNVDYPIIAGAVTSNDYVKNKGSNKGKGKKKGHHKRNGFESTTPPSFVSYTYDLVGNRLSKTEDQQTTYYQYNEANQLLNEGDTVYNYDANGNRISKIDSHGESRYTYNTNNLLVRFTDATGRSTGYGYDGFNRRVYKSSDNEVVESYLYDGLDILQEITGPNSQKVTSYYRANGRIVAQQKYNISHDNPGEYSHRPEGRKLYYTYDALGSISSLSNHQGKQKTRYVYDVFGEVLSGDLSQNQYTFTGKRFDLESELYHFHFRQYDAKVGVWTTPDPIGIWGGINVYSYVENNPVNYRDLFGLWSDMGDGYGGDLGDSSEVEGPASHHDPTPGDLSDGGYGWGPDGNWGFIDGVISISTLDRLTRNGNYWNGHATTQNIPSLADLEALSNDDKKVGVNTWGKYWSRQNIYPQCDRALGSLDPDYKDANCAACNIRSPYNDSTIPIDGFIGPWDTK